MYVTINDFYFLSHLVNAYAYDCLHFPIYSIKMFKHKISDTMVLNQ